MNYKAITLIILATFVMASCKKEAEKVEDSVTYSAPADAPSAVEEAPKVDPNGKFAKMDFSKLEHDFGTINPNEKVETVFTFTNTGEANLVISKATGSCGCTAPDYPKEPIAPGEKAEIKVVFDPKGKNGMQNKTVTLTTNTASGMEKLAIKANIVK